MVVAGPEVAVGHELPLLAPHHLAHLGVRLELDEAEDHLRAGALEVARPADVGLFVEPRLELDQRGDRLAGLRREHQRLDDRAVARGAVERLLDGDDVGVARRLHQELRDDVEALERVVDEDVLLPDRREAIAVEVADALGIARMIGRELAGPARSMSQMLRGIGETEETLDLEGVA